MRGFGLFWSVILVTSIAGIGGTGLGGVISSLIRRDSKKVVSLLLSFASGVMLAIVCFMLIGDTIFGADEPPLTDLLWLLLGLIAGYGLVALLNHWIDRSTNDEVAHVAHDDAHPRTADDLDELIHSDHFVAHKKKNDHLFIAGVVIAVVISLHHLPEGMVVGAAYAASTATSAWQGGGVFVATMIGLQNVPEGMAVAAPLIAGGVNRWKALLVAAACGIPTVIGAGLGYLLGSLSPLWSLLAVGFASGAMLYVVFGELLPESILMWKSKTPAFAVVAGILAGLLVLVL